MNIYLTIRRETERFRDRTAVIDGETRVSYHALFSAVDQAAAVLKAEGVGPCDRVGILCGGRLGWCGPLRDVAGDGRLNLERIFLSYIGAPAKEASAC